MSIRVFPALVAAAVLAGCGGNPFLVAPSTPVPPIVAPPPDVPDDLIPEGAASGSVENAGGLATWSSSDAVISVQMDAQVLPGVAGNFVRDAAFDVTRNGTTYYGYSYQSTPLNRKAVVLVQESGAITAMIAMEPGQFANGAPDMYHSGGAMIQASVFRAPTGGLYNYEGTYAGLLNVGTAAGTPPGSLTPTQPYRTVGTSLITADFTRMRVSGGVTNRAIVDAGAVVGGVPVTDLPDIALWTTGIETNGQFEGVVYTGDMPPATDPLYQDWRATGRFEGLFAGLNASDVAVIMLFQPLGDDIWEQGIIVGACTLTDPDRTCP